MIKQRRLHFGQGHISVVSIVPRENGKSMERTCPIPCTYTLTEVTDRKDLAQQSTQKTFQRSSGTVSAKWRYGISIVRPNCSIQFPADGMQRLNWLWKFDIKAKFMQVDQRYRSDAVWSLIGFILFLAALHGCCCRRAAAQLAALLISLRLKTLHVPWKTTTQSSDIDRATLRWVFLFLPVCGSWTKDGGLEAVPWADPHRTTHKLQAT